jgi:HEAT repeat protein
VIDSGDLSLEREAVRKICGRLHQAYRGLRLYPPDHPTARHTLAEFHQALASYLDSHGSIMLRITEEEMLFEDEEVYSYEEPRGNLAFLMFRDGLRFLTFHPGVDEGETEAFVDCLAHADNLVAIEYDLPTVLWERDLQHIDYEVVDPFLGAGGEELRERALNDLRETVVSRLRELSPGVGVEGRAASAAEGDSPGDREDAIVAESTRLTQEDVERTEQAVAELDDILADFAVVMLEIAGAPAVDAEGEESVARALSGVAEQFLAGVDLVGLEMMVNRISDLIANGRRPPEFGTHIFGRVATVEHLTQLMALMGRDSPEQTRQVELLLHKLRDWVLPALLEMLAESSDKSVRKAALALLNADAGVPLVYLWPLMEDPRWYVVRNAVGLATGSGDPALVDHLEPLLGHSDARVRREVVRSLDTIGNQKSASLVARALVDPDVSVRVLAANSLGRHGNRAHFGAVAAQIEARDFPARPAEEIAALLAAYAALGSASTVEDLNRLWKRKLLGTKPLAVRLGAIQALGLVATPPALNALRLASTSGDAQIRRAASRALAEAQARTGDAAG